MARRGDSCQREYRFRWNETLLSEVQMARHCATFQISLGQHAAYSRVVQRLNARDHLTVLALGGSAIYGADCHDRRVAPQECSFPGRFVRALRLSYCMDEGYLKFVNHASGGQGTVAALPQLQSLLMIGDPRFSAAPDLVIIDYSVNDVASGTYLREQPIAGPAMVEAATEVMVRQILASFPTTAILMVDQECRKLLEPRKRWETIEAHRRVAYAYGVPYLSYGGMLRGACDEEAFGQDRAAQGMAIHPGAITHQLTADALAFFWWRGLSLLPRTSITSNVTSPDGHYITNETLRSKLAICQAVCRYDAHSLYAQPGTVSPDGCGALNNVTVLSGNFTLHEDRPGKPGWITTGPVGSAIEFVLHFGASPRLTLVVEQSYEGFGLAEVTFGHAWLPRRNRAWVQGTRNDGRRITTAEVISLNVQQVPGVTQGFGMLPHAQNQRMRLTLRTAGKFKIRHISSC